MSSELKTNKVSPSSGTALQIGDSGDTITIPSGATLTNSGTATGFGKVLQVVSTFKDDGFTTGNTTMTDVTGLTATITPSATSSKILVFGNCVLDGVGGTVWADLVCSIGGGSETIVGCGGVAGSRTLAFGNSMGSTNEQATVIFLHTTNTTSACVYKIRVKCESGGNAYVGRTESDTDAATHARYGSSIILAEIGA